jgi:Phosphoglucose isomerase
VTSPGAPLAGSPRSVATLEVATTGLEVAPDVRAALAGDDVTARMMGGDPTLWGPDAEADAAACVGWLDLPAAGRHLLAPLAELRARLRDEGVDRVVLCGTGGSSLAAEVVCQAAGVPLLVLTTTDPGRVAAALRDLARTVVVVSSKSGNTPETDSLRRLFGAAFVADGLPASRLGERFVVVTDPGTPLAELAAALPARAVFLTDPRVGGRWSALSAYGLVPAALAGADVAALLDEAARLAERFAAPDNPALALGAALGAASSSGHDRVGLAGGDDGPDPCTSGFGAWVEHLLAGSTGKKGRGLLPVVLESTDAPGAAAPDVLLAVVGGPPAGPGPSVGVRGPLGAQFLGWEYATAVAGRLLGVNPFDTPDVDETTAHTRLLLQEGLPEDLPLATIGAVQLHAPDGLLDRVDLSQHDGLSLAFDALLAALPPRGYLAVSAYLDRGRDVRAAELRAALAARTDRAVTFGWGPRHLHSTGQYHLGGPPSGCFLQVTGAVEEDLPVPDRPFTCGDLQAAQAAGDRQALVDHGRPLLWLHLTDRAAGVEQLLDAVC